MNTKLAHESPISIFDIVQKATDYEYCLVHLLEESEEYRKKLLPGGYNTNTHFRREISLGEISARGLPLYGILTHNSKGRPHRTAVFDFRFRARYEPQLIPESIRATRPDPVWGESVSMQSECRVDTR